MIFDFTCSIAENIAVIVLRLIPLYPGIFVFSANKTVWHLHMSIYSVLQTWQIPIEWAISRAMRNYCQLCKNFPELKGSKTGPAHYGAFGVTSQRKAGRSSNSVQYAYRIGHREGLGGRKASSDACDLQPRPQTLSFRGDYQTNKQAVSGRCLGIVIYERLTLPFGFLCGRLRDDWTWSRRVSSTVCRTSGG